MKNISYSNPISALPDHWLTAWQTDWLFHVWGQTHAHTNMFKLQPETTLKTTALLQVRTLSKINVYKNSATT